VEENEVVLVELPVGVIVVSVLGRPTESRPTGHACQVRHKGELVREVQSVTDVADLLRHGIGEPQT
jgi:hypothetical protein